MKVFELVEWLDKKYTPKAAENWDNVGLLVGEEHNEVKHIFLALDLTEEVLKQAINVNADMIITHHPMIFSGIKKINNKTSNGRKIISLIRNNISYYAMHTNYDVLGMADLSAEYLGLLDTEVLAPTYEENGKAQGFGRVGRLPYKMTLKEFSFYVKKCNKLESVRVYGELEKEIERVAICTGSGKSMIKEAFAADADVYVTGDIDHHTGIDAAAENLAIVDAGHYGTEYIFSEAVKSVLLKHFPDLTISCEKVKSPFSLL